ARCGDAHSILARVVDDGLVRPTSSPARRLLFLRRSGAMYKGITLAILLAGINCQSALATAPPDHFSSPVNKAAARCFGKQPANWQQMKDACAAVLAGKDLQPLARAVALYNR